MWTVQVCSNKPVKECDTRPKTVFKKLPDTTCERIPFEACAPDNCKPSKPAATSFTTMKVSILVPLTTVSWFFIR